MPRKGTKSDPREFIRAASDERGASELAYNCRWHTSVAHSFSPYVLALVTVVTDAPELEVRHRVCRLEASWPNGTAESFEAFFYQHCYKVARLVEGHYNGRGQVAPLKITR